MTPDAQFVFGLLAVTVVLFASDRLRPDVVAILVILALILGGSLTVSEAVAGFGDPLVPLIAGLFVVGEGLVRTGIAYQVGVWLTQLAGTSETRLLVLLMLAARLDLYWLLLLVPAWARLGVLWWARLPAIKPGLGERFAWRAPAWIPWGWLFLLAAAGLTCPVLLGAPMVILTWHRYLAARLGGMTGDALGAGVEVSESALLLAGVLAALA